MPFSKIPNHYPRAALLLSEQRIDEVRSRDFGVGYGNSSGYANGRRYTCEWATPRFRMTWARAAPPPSPGDARGMARPYHRAMTTAPLFRHAPDCAALNAQSRNTAMQALGIVFTEVGADYLRATMPVDARTHQPYGLLHGGASALLAETLGSTAGMLCAEEGQAVVGIEINANHLRGVRSGSVTGTARALHVGRNTQVWDIRIEDEAQRLVCVSRLTLAVVPKAAI